MTDPHAPGPAPSDRPHPASPTGGAPSGRLDSRSPGDGAATPDTTRGASPGPIPFLKLTITGVFMGLANLVPGVSGGTMVLALGLYDEFIRAFSDLTRLRFSIRAVAVVAILFGVSAGAIFLLANGIQFLMESYLPAMLALFIGMTLGGAPLLCRQMRPLRWDSVVFALLSFGLMALLVVAFRREATSPGWLYFLLGGMAGSAAMILPGISGSYLLLLMGLYLPIIGAIADFKDALRAVDLALAFQVGAGVLLPVAIGLVLGLALLSNLLRFVLRRYHRRAIGFLLGLLLGSVLGLYPFQTPQFDRLARYAVDGELRVLGYGWQAQEGSVVFERLRALENGPGAVRLRVVGAWDDRGPDGSDLDAARAESAILIAYNTAVLRDVRRAASRSQPKIELLIVPDAEFSPGRAALAVVMAVIGFFVTFLLSRMDRKPDRNHRGAPEGTEPV